MLQPRVSICATEEIKGSLRVGLFRMIEGRIRSFLYSLRWVDSVNRLKNLKDSVQWPEPGGVAINIYYPLVHDGGLHCR